MAAGCFLAHTFNVHLVVNNNNSSFKKGQFNIVQIQNKFIIIFIYIKPKYTTNTTTVNKQYKKERLIKSCFGLGSDHVHAKTGVLDLGLLVFRTLINLFLMFSHIGN